MIQIILTRKCEKHFNDLKLMQSIYYSCFIEFQVLKIKNTRTVLNNKITIYNN